MRLSELRCRNCGAPLAAENVVEHLSMARCSHCNAVFALEPDGPIAAGAGQAALRPQVAMPSGIKVEDVGTALQISRRWFNVSAFFLLFFSIFWNGFMLVWHGIAISSGAWIMSAFGLLHTAVGVGVAYATAGMFLNTTYVRVGNGMIEVKTEPVPWWGNKWLTADDISQFYCMEQVHRGKNGTSYTYDVMCLRNDGVRDTLVQGLQDSTQALFIEQELERFLGIKDQPVDGELRR